jgi:hypothetical protein
MTAYYLNDFHSVLAGVEARYGGLLDARELAYMATVRALSEPGQLLYARLANRKGPFFRVARLNYAEIGGLEAPCAELVAGGLLEACVGRPADGGLARLLGCFRHDELAAALPCPAPRTKAALLGWLAEWVACEGWLADLLARHAMVRLPADNPWPFLRFLFFGELRDNLADFVTRALGHIVTESVEAGALRPHFASRRAADDAYRMAVLYQGFREVREAGDARAALEWWQRQAVVRAELAEGWQWFDRLVDRLGRMLERAGEDAAAMALYGTSPVAPARERLARLLVKAKRTDEAMRLLRTMQEAPCHAEEAYAARQLLARLEQKTRRSEARHYQLESRTLRLDYLPRSGFARGGEAPRVEAAVLAHYRAQGWQGVHAENWLWNASFGLLLWDIIYDGSLGVFHSPLQFAPSDLYAPEFYARRREKIEARLALLARPEAAMAIMQRHFAAKQGLANPFVAWHETLPEVLGVMVRRLPAAGHAAALRHMAGNLRHHASGFLDLFIWNETDYRFIEIKGENDHLAGHQYEWLRFLAEAGINVSLEKVTQAGHDISPGAT